MTAPDASSTFASTTWPASGSEDQTFTVQALVSSSKVPSSVRLLSGYRSSQSATLPSARARPIASSSERSGSAGWGANGVPTRLPRES